MHRRVTEVAASAPPTLLRQVEEAFRTLPSRYLGAAKGFDATYHVRLGDIGHCFEVRCTEGRALAEVRTFTYPCTLRHPPNALSLSQQSDPNFTRRVAQYRRYTPQPYCRQMQSLLAIVGVGHVTATSDFLPHSPLRPSA